MSSFLVQNELNKYDENEWVLENDVNLKRALEPHSACSCTVNSGEIYVSIEQLPLTSSIRLFNVKISALKK